MSAGLTPRCGHMICEGRAVCAFTVPTVTIRQRSADDPMSWAVFINGTVAPSLTGLTYAQARSFRQKVVEDGQA